jgi:hypothetical protein
LDESEIEDNQVVGIMCMPTKDSVWRKRFFGNSKISW